MSFDITSVSSKNHSIQTQSAGLKRTPENFSEETAANENHTENAGAATASNRETSKEPRHFPTFRSALSAETMQTLMRMYAR